MTAPLPPCPLCVGRCHNCGRDLAAPLAPEVVAVLRKAETWRFDEAPSVEEELGDAVSAWLAADRPGLPPEKE